MSETPDRTPDVDAVVRAVPGVVRLFPSDSAVVRSARRLVEDAPALITVAGDGETLVTVAVDSGAVAREVAEAVADAVRTVLGADAAVRVRVSRIAAADR